MTNAIQPPLREAHCPFCERRVIVYEDPARCPLCACPFADERLGPMAFPTEHQPPTA